MEGATGPFFDSENLARKQYKRDHGCHLKQHSDTVYCHDCDEAWDANDPMEPPCPDQRSIKIVRLSKVLSQLFWTTAIGVAIGVAASAIINLIRSIYGGQ